MQKFLTHNDIISQLYDAPESSSKLKKCVREADPC